jgi:DNA-binding winged helix-turn-helix (wHTH) protein/TolB-like protein/Flp pilus assembly protein TadD
MAEANEKPDKYSFDGFTVLAESRLLRNTAGETVPLTPKVFDTLLYLVENAGRVTDKDELLTAIWPDAIVEENSLNKNISVLRRVLGEKQGENRYIATIPGRGYKFVAQVAASNTNESIESQPVETKHSKQFDSENASISKNTQFKPIFIAVASMIVLALVVAGIYFLRRPANETVARSVAVLPFKPLAADNRDEVLEIGMADTLIARLANDRYIVVRPLASVRRFGNLEQDPLVAGRELGVEAVLDGSLQRVGDQIRINARLIQTADGASLWSETFDERFTDIFALQDRIANKIAEALNARLGAKQRDKSGTENIEAYRLYLQGRYHALKSTPPEIRQGIQFYRQAIAADPNYALAYAGIAQAFVALPITSDVAPAEAFPEAKNAAEQALRIDPDLAAAHVALGTVDFWYEWKWNEAEVELKKAIALEPNNPDAHRFYAVFLTVAGRADESMAEIEKARQLDPLSLIINALKAQAFIYSGRDGDALEQANKTLEIEPGFWIAHLMRARVLIGQAKFDEAARAAEQAEQFSGGNSEATSLIAYSLAKGEKKPEARALLEKLKERAKQQYVPSYNLAMIFNGFGERDEAIRHLQLALETRDARMILLKVEPKWNEYRSDPRFAEIVRQVNF